MILQAIFFYLFSGVCIASRSWWSPRRNPVHSVLFLILAFFNAAGLFVLLGAEFLAMILVVVYVGAVAVLFLFVVMMLDIDFAELRQGFLNYLPVGGSSASSCWSSCCSCVGVWVIDAACHKAITAPIADAMSPTPGARPPALYQLCLLLPGRGMILLVAMIGAIVLTLQHGRGASASPLRRRSRAGADRDGNASR